jgi:SET domain-containing protein
MRDYLPRSWISPKLAGGKSAIHGMGVIARAPIARGERVMEFGGLAIQGDQVDTDIHRVRSIWQVDDDLWLVLPRTDTAPSLDENLNHSCDSNCWLADAVTLVARRDIAAGEEITLDQGTWNYTFEEGVYTVDQEHCSCGAEDCRKALKEDDWKLAVLRERYRGHFHPLLQRMIDRA